MSPDNPILRLHLRGRAAGLLASAHLDHVFGGRWPPSGWPGPPEGVVVARQVHGARVVVVGAESRPEALRDVPADALVARAPAPPVGVWTADCVPLLAGARGAPVCGAAHAGWRGAVAGILPAWVGALTAQGVVAEDLRVALGPAIGPCCFRIGEEVAARLMAAWRAAAGPPGEAAGCLRRAPDGAPYADLWALCRRQLSAAGVVDDHIEVVRRCTACSPDLHSYRRDGAASGRQLSAIVAGAVLPFGSGGD